MGPGYTPTTKIPCDANSPRTLCVKECTAALDAQYVPSIGIPKSPPMDEILTKAPGLFVFKMGAKARVIFNRPK